jgi:hypothetical protein
MQLDSFFLCFDQINITRHDDHKSLSRDNAAAAMRSRRDRDVGLDYPPPGDLIRRPKCEHDLRLFLESYSPNAFTLEFSAAHKRIIGQMETAIREGGLYAICIPRGGGKTSISVRASIWALLYKHRRFLRLLGATERRATDQNHPSPEPRSDLIRVPTHHPSPERVQTPRRSRPFSDGREP